jgi:hypothetical protein
MQNLLNENIEFNNDKLLNSLSYSQIISSVHYILQTHLIKNLSIGNIFIDTVLHFCILSIIIYTIINLKDIFYNILYLLNKLFDKLFNKYNLKSKNIIITNKSLILFSSVKWYLSSLSTNNIVNNNSKKSLNTYSWESSFINNDKDVKLEYFYDKNKKLIKKYIKLTTFDFTIEFLYNELELDNNDDINLLFTKIKNIDSIEVFLNSCISTYENYLKNNSINYKNMNDYWIYEENNKNYSIDSVILDDNFKCEIINNMQNFINSKNKYNYFNILFKKTYLFHGSSGTGKSLFIKSLANHLNYKIYYLNLDNINSQNDIIKLLDNINCEKSILVIENINLEKNTLINACTKHMVYDDISNMLNIIYNHNFLSELVILTTNLNAIDNYNNLEFIDVKYKFNNCSNYQFKSFYNKFYNNIIPLNILNKINTNLFTPLQLIKIYLNNINNEKKFLLEISKKNVADLNEDIHNYFDKGMGLINNNKLILSVIVLTHFSYLFKTHDLLKRL